MKANQFTLGEMFQMAPIINNVNNINYVNDVNDVNDVNNGKIGKKRRPHSKTLKHSDARLPEVST